MSYHKKYQESIELIRKLERILELKKREKSFKSKKAKKDIAKEKVELKDILEKSESDEQDNNEEKIIANPEEIKKHDDLVKDLVENKDDLSEFEIKERLDRIAEEAPEGWEPTEQLRDFYKDISENNGISADFNTAASLFLGVDKSDIEKVRTITISGYGLFVRLMKAVYPEEYHDMIDNSYQEVVDKIPKRYMNLYVKKFTHHAGGPDELAKKLVQIGSKDDKEGQFKYSGGTIEIGSDHSRDARIGLFTAMSSALWDVMATSVGFGSEEDEAYVNTEIQMPIKKYKRISSEYGMRDHPKTNKRKMHWGIDIPAAKGTYIYPIMTGVVTKVGYNDSGRGNWIEVDHKNGYSSRYLHCTSIFLNKGESASLDTIIASVGSTGMSTGNHLHLEIRKDGQIIDPMEVLKDLL